MHTRRARMAEQGTSLVTASPRHQKVNGGARRGNQESAGKGHGGPERTGAEPRVG